MCNAAGENQAQCCHPYGLRVQGQPLFLVCSSITIFTSMGLGGIAMSDHTWQRPPPPKLRPCSLGWRQQKLLGDLGPLVATPCRKLYKGFSWKPHGTPERTWHRWTGWRQSCSNPTKISPEIKYVWHFSSIKRKGDSTLHDMANPLPHILGNW